MSYQLSNIIKENVNLVQKKLICNVQEVQREDKLDRATNN